MKHLKSIFRFLLGTLLLMMSSSKYALAQEHPGDDYEHLDSAISLSLLTCQPGEESWSLYGHTAIHYINRNKGIDVAVNYGMFNFHKPFFVLRFIFGLTDYEMGVQPYDYFCEAYAYEKRGIIEQELNFLTPQDKAIIVKALEDNYLPENREYRYNFFYDNCTTRARDMLLIPCRNHGSINFKRKAAGPSFRELTHKYTSERPWVQLGNDLLLGVKADRPTTISEQQFLPFNLLEDFDNATLKLEGSEATPLKIVGKKTTVVPMFKRDYTKKDFPLSPTTCAIILALTICIITLFEHVRHRIIWAFDLALLIPIGICGLILTAMIFSQHPTVNLNLQILLLNPIAIACLFPIISHERKGHGHWFWFAYSLCLQLFLAGNAIQCYAEGTNILASSLLYRCYVRIKQAPTLKKQTVNQDI